MNKLQKIKKAIRKQAKWNMLDTLRRLETDLYNHELALCISRYWKESRKGRSFQTSGNTSCTYFLLLNKKDRADKDIMTFIDEVTERLDLIIRYENTISTGMKVELGKRGNYGIEINLIFVIHEKGVCQVVEYDDYIRPEPYKITKQKLICR